jgi:haloalkane dehalogenase
MIPQLINEGYHVIAPDLIGFGKSDKPIQSRDHSYSAHVKSRILN